MRTSEPVPYERALGLWGAARLNAHFDRLLRSGYPLAVPERVGPEDVRVEFHFEEGYSCCGGRDPSCYCSYAQSPVAEVRITDTRPAEGSVVTIDAADFDFTTVLGEIIAAAGGLVSSRPQEAQDARTRPDKTRPRLLHGSLSLDAPGGPREA